MAGGDAVLQVTPDSDQLAQRLRDADQRGEESEQVAHGHAAGDGVRYGYVEDDCDAQRGHELHDRVGETAGKNEAHVRAQVVLVDRVELAVEVVLGVVDLDQPRRLEALLGNAGDVAHRVLDAAAVAAEAPVDDGDQPAHEGTDGERHQGESGVQPQEVADRADEW